MKTTSFPLLRHSGLCAPAIWALSASALFFVSAAVARPPSSSTAADLDGRWYHDGKPTRILVAPDGRSITIINEFGQSSDGYANGPSNLVIPSLGVTGTVNKKGRRISWTNGTEWTREAKTADSRGSLNGRWFRNGQPARIDMRADGKNFSITNEWGLRATGFVTRSGEIKVQPWLVTGHLSTNGLRISWSNGTEWTRPRLF